jgi:hypothetical protein
MYAPGGNVMSPKQIILGTTALALFACPMQARSIAGDDAVPRSTAKPEARISVDPRVELISIVFRLAGHPEYNQARIPSYVDDVEEQFGKLHDHAVVKKAQSLRANHGVSFDACMSMAVHLTDTSRLDERVPFDPRPASLDQRWTPQDAREFLGELKDFVKVSKFQEFLVAHRPLYAKAEERMRRLLDKEGHLEWFSEFFGARPGCRFTIALGLLNGPSNYGPRCRLPDGSEELYCILGAWSKDSQGEPTFGSDVLETVIHEFCHSYANPIIDRHASELRTAAEALYAPVAAAMKRQAYGNWITMMYESLVRACTIRYIQRYQGRDAATSQTKQEQGPAVPLGRRPLDTAGRVRDPPRSLSNPGGLRPADRQLLRRSGQARASATGENRCDDAEGRFGDTS